MGVYLQDADLTVYHGDALETLRELPAESVHMCVTSPPFFGLRDYGTGSWEGGDPACDHAPDARPRSQRAAGGLTGGTATVDVATPPFRDVCGKCGARRVDQQIGLEESPDEWVASLVAVFREVHRVLRRDGTLWVEVGDSYAATMTSDRRMLQPTRDTDRSGGVAQRREPQIASQRTAVNGLKPKDLVGAPWKLAEALKAPYYTGNISAERDRVWLSATLDAEGSICGHIHRRKDDGSIRTGLHITITNSAARLLDEAHRIWPASRVVHERRDGSLGVRPCWRWVATNVDRNALLMRELYPYMLVKRKQALLAWNFLEMSRVSKRIGKLREGEEARGRREWIVRALSTLNHGGDVDVPSWCSEPPSVFEGGWFLRSDIIWARLATEPDARVGHRPAHKIS